MIANKLAKGFTLIELMITVAIVGILSAIAVPAYLDSILKGRRAEGRAALTDLLLQQERLMTQSNSYMIFPAGANGVPFKTYSGNSPKTGAYMLGAELCPGAAINECVRVFAIPVKPDPKVNKLSMTSVGEKACTGTVQKLCWN